MCVCTEGTAVGWIRDVFGECIYNDVQHASFYIGLSSILFWVPVIFPQVFKNCKQGNADALSGTFLLIWLLGDVTNLLGAVLSLQLPTQIATAVYFVFTDVLLDLQWLYYKMKHRGARSSAHKDTERRELLDGDRKKHTSVSSTSWIPAAALVLLFMVTPYLGHLSSSSSPSSSSSWFFDAAPSTGSGAHGQRVLLSSDSVECGDMPAGQEWRAQAGYWVGWVSAALYLGSRTPQIILNFKRRCTDGLSCWLFIFAVMGNTTYGISVFIFGHDLLPSIPWIAGSVGTLAFDFTLLIQFCVFGSKKPTDEENLLMEGTSSREDDYLGDGGEHGGDGDGDDDDEDEEEGGIVSNSSSAASTAYQDAPVAAEGTMPRGKRGATPSTSLRNTGGQGPSNAV